MKLVHFESPVPNFGDDLNAQLWPRLAPDLFAASDKDRGFVGIGTIIGMDVGELVQLEVFSSGAGYDRIAKWANKRVTFHCVRGPVTARLLGLEPELALTDGAILTPLVDGFPSRATGGGGTAVVPHFETIAFPGWDAACRQAGFRLLDPRGTPAEVIEQIAAAELVLTESLHGAVLADTYGVPWIPFATSRNFGTSKWVDWTASVGLDFDLRLVPPPNAQQLIAFGKRSEPYGATLRFTLEQAVGEFNVRMEAPPRNPLKEVAKAVIRRTPMAGRLLGYHPARTAEALTALATMPPMQSKAALRAELSARMFEALQKLARSAGQKRS
jgi:succinoglycan biosynthesis protein ExoV